MTLLLDNLNTRRSPSYVLLKCCTRAVALAVHPRRLALCLVSIQLLLAQPLDDQNILEAMSQSVQALTARVAPSVVQILVTRYATQEEIAGGRTSLVLSKQQSVGSGVIVTPDGYIVTNAHVVAGAQRIRVNLSSQSAPENRSKPDQIISGALADAFTPSIEATLVGVFTEGDLALVKIPEQNLPALPFADYRKLRQGQVVFAFGSREGLRNSVSMGVVSSVARQPDSDNPFIYIQTDAAINPGDSGGPLVNTAGEVVGLDTFIMSKSGGNEGIGFAIPSPMIQIITDQLKKHGHFHRLVMGIGAQSITPNLAAALRLPRNCGVVVSDIQPASPAASAGLKVNDVILSFDGRVVDNLPMFAMDSLQHRRDQPVQLQVLRGAKTLSFEVQPIEESHASDRIVDFINPETSQILQLGIAGVAIDARTEAMFPGLRGRYGVYVAARSAASTNSVDLQIGDVIHEINGKAVADLATLRMAMIQFKRGDAVALFIERQGNLMYLAFEIE